MTITMISNNIKERLTKNGSRSIY